MARSLVSDDFCETVVPVILSNSIQAHFRALRWQSRYGIASVLCGQRKNIFDMLSLDSGFLLLDGERGRLAAEQLIDFAEDWRECILVLIPVTDSDRAFISQNIEVLESRYLISFDGGIDSLPIDSPERWV